MTSIDDQLRVTFQAAAAAAPVRPDPADAAIRRAGRIRRTRALVVSGAAAVVLIAAVGTSALLSDGRPQATVHPATPPTKPADGTPRKIQLDMFDGKRIVGPNTDVALTKPVTAEGYHDSLTRVRGGWLYVDRSDVSFISRDGAVKALAGVKNRSLTISPQGDRLAWGNDGTVFTAKIDIAGTPHLVEQRSTPVPEMTSAHGWLGDRLLLRKNDGCCGGDGMGEMPAKWDIWDPAKGPFVPTWPLQEGRILGATSDNAGLLGLATQNGKVCFQLLDAVTFEVDTERCDLGLIDDMSQTVALSPDRRMLVDVLADSNGVPRSTLLVNVASALDGKPVAAVTRTVPGCTESTESLWETDDAVIGVDRKGQLTRWAWKGAEKVPGKVRGVLVPRTQFTD